MVEITYIGKGANVHATFQSSIRNYNYFKVATNYHNVAVMFIPTVDCYLKKLMYKHKRAKFNAGFEMGFKGDANLKVGL